MKNRFSAYAIAYMHRDNKVLLLKRSVNASFAPENYCLVGGLLEHNEPFRRALVREIDEEVGVYVKEEDLHFVHMFHRIGPNFEGVVAVFECMVWKGEPFNKEPHKHTELIWADIDHLPEPMISAHRSALKLIQQKQLYSEQD
jgi:8-oxo-dGTP diphosphatase